MDEKTALGLISRCSKWDGYTFDPLSHIQAVNLLQPLGKEQVLASLRAFWQKAEASNNRLDDSTRMVLLLRLLFVPKSPNQNFPTIRTGNPVVYPSLPEKEFPLFPLALVEAVPLLISPGFSLGGLPENPLNQIDFCEHNCVIRPAPLSPPDNPLPLAEKLLQNRSVNKDSQDLPAILQAQLLRLVSSVYPVAGENDFGFFSSLQKPAIWQKHVQAFSDLKAHWSSTQNDYQASV